MAASKEGAQPIIIKKIKKGGHGHHGGAWKVAYADFVTAMMAFFLLLWLMGSTTTEQKRYIAGYFQDPSGVSPIGPGGAAPGVIPMEDAAPPPPAGQLDNMMSNLPGQAINPSSASEREAFMREEMLKLEELQRSLESSIQRDPMFELLKDQVMMDITPLGLRIRIVDQDNRPSFMPGSAQLQERVELLLETLALTLNSVPNRISITGHTDSVPLKAGTYTNWELSADRANAARRALIAGDYPEEKIAKVEGYAGSLPIKASDPENPINRRIGILVLKKEVDDSLREDSGTTVQDLMLRDGSLTTELQEETPLMETPPASPSAAMPPSQPSPKPTNAPAKSPAPMNHHPDRTLEGSGGDDIDHEILDSEFLKPIDLSGQQSQPKSQP